MAPTNKQKVVFKGNDPMIAPLITDAFNGLPGIELYDQTDSTNKAVSFEAELGRKGYLAPGQAPDFSKRPSSFDLEVTGRNGVIELRAGHQVHRVPVPKFQTIEQMNAFGKMVVLIMRSMLTRKVAAAAMS